MSLGDVYMVFLSDIILYLERVRVNKIEDWRRKWRGMDEGTRREQRNGFEGKRESAMRRKEKGNKTVKGMLGVF
ncbi:hypothetical protein FHS19_004398 [Paenibacillus rhizosphaerae]|uniref:Uncharacterized protein n=1 Tax=Paenibacillus rhizosphaerae TaxID=297318 RepID=A0A839TT86_9BACL|nr:hypothetical protein [Paenibacillus rhizosphaerae]MBB3129723.1 hypothetical protein [Paenibacillus rhizosphaerae]